MDDAYSDDVYCDVYDDDVYNMLYDGSLQKSRPHKLLGVTFSVGWFFACYRFHCLIFFCFCLLSVSLF